MKKQDKKPQGKAQVGAKKSIEQLDNPIFKKNLQALFHQDEILAARLFGMGGHEKYDVFVGKDPLDINIIDRKTLKYVYERPVADVTQNLETTEKEYKRYPIMYFYGLGNGVFYKALLKNQTHERVIVIEPGIEIIYIVLNLIDLSEELESERLVLFLSEFSTYTQFYFLVVEKKFSAYAKTYNLHVHTPFYEQFNEDILRINENFVRAISQMVAAHGNSIDDTLIGVQHHLENLPTMVTNYCYADLVKKRHELMDTAIIVATGPSLDKQLETLKIYAPYVTVISLDASYPILLKHGIAPDYVTSIERVVPTSTFFEKSDAKLDENAYFIVASLTHRKTIKNILPRRLALTMRPQQDEKGYKLDDFGYLGIGHSTANQAYQLAYALGHKNIVLIGQDLAFAPDGKSHASGHAFAQSDEYLYIPAYGGEGEVRTTYVWDKFKNQYEKDIEQSNLEGFKTYNCTEGGARIKGSIERPFLETMKELTEGKEPKNLPNTNKVSDKRADKYLLKAYKHVIKKIQTQNLVRERVEKTFLKIVPQIDEILERKENIIYDEALFENLVKISDEIDAAKDFLSKEKFRPYAENIIVMAVYYQELELAKISVKPSDTLEQKITKLIEWAEIHKYWLFSVAGALHADTQTTKKASKNLVNELKARKLITKNEIGEASENFEFSID